MDIQAPLETSTDGDDPITFSRVLRPHRSSSERAISIVTLSVLFLFIPTGTASLVVSAWPVFGFMGLEVAELIFALRYNHKVGSAFEAISISERAVKVSKVDHWGKRKHLDLPAAMAADPHRRHLQATDHRHARQADRYWQVSQ